MVNRPEGHLPDNISQRVTDEKIRHRRDDCGKVDPLIQNQKGHPTGKVEWPESETLMEQGVEDLCRIV